jgi:Phage integrase family
MPTRPGAVLNTAVGDRLEALAVLVLAVGLRQGETFNLHWDDVDLDAATVTIPDAKTDAGRRTVAVPPFVCAALRAHRIRQLEERLRAPVWHDPTLVFASTTGTRLDPRNALRWWHDLTVRAGVGRRRFHASRHTAATLMLNNGVALEVVSATLGHAGYAITADVSAKVRPQLQRRAADAREGVLGNDGPTISGHAGPGSASSGTRSRSFRRRRQVRGDPIGRGRYRMAASGRRYEGSCRALARHKNHKSQRQLIRHCVCTLSAGFLFSFFGPSLSEIRFAFQRRDGSRRAWLPDRQPEMSESPTW